MGGIGQKQQTQTQPSISCLPGVTSGGETSATHHCKQPLHKDADDGQYSQASAFFFQRSPAPRPLHGKMAQSRQALLVPTHYQGRAGAWRDGWCFLVQQSHRVQVRWYSWSLVSAGTQHQGMFAASWTVATDLCDCQLAAFHSQCSGLSVISPIKQVLGCFPSTSTLLPVHPPLLPFVSQWFLSSQVLLQVRAEISAFWLHSTLKVSPVRWLRALVVLWAWGT